MVATEKCFARSNPCISGAHRFFGRAKQEYFSIPQEQREGMRDAKSFITFWQGIVVKKELPNPLQHYAAAVLLSCCSSCATGRSISLLNRIVTALCNRMSWKSIGMHLIGAEDVDDVNYPYTEVVLVPGVPHLDGMRNIKTRRPHNGNQAQVGKRGHR